MATSRAEEPLLQPISSGPVGLHWGRGIDGKRHTGIAVPEPDLSGLHVDAGDNQGGRRQAAEIMEAGIGTARGPDRRRPDAPAPVLVSDGPSVNVGENELIDIGRRQTDQGQMASEHVDQRIRQGHRSDAGPRLGWTGNEAAANAAGDGLSDRECSGIEVDTTDPESDHFGPPETEHGTQPDHRLVAVRDAIGNALDVGWTEVMTTGDIEGRQVHPATGRAGQPVVGHGEGEHRSKDPVLAPNAARCTGS